MPECDVSIHEVVDSAQVIETDVWIYCYKGQIHGIAVIQHISRVSRVFISKSNTRTRKDGGYTST